MYYILLLLIPVFLTVIYFTFPITYLLSAIFLISLYALLVPSLFFTFGAYIERKSLELQIDRVVNVFTTVANSLNINITDLNVPEDESNDDIESRNRKIIEEAFLMMGILFAGGICTGLLLYYKFKTKFDLNLVKIVRSTLFILVAIIIIELAYFGLIVRNYRSLSTNDIISTLAGSIANKL